MNLSFQTILAANYSAGLLEGLVWNLALLAGAFCALLAVILSLFLPTRRASQISGYCALLCNCLATLILFLLVYPVVYSADGHSEETRWNLVTVSSCTAAVLLARLFAAVRTSRAHKKPKAAALANDRIA